jgi:nitroimidazol reductase NimA-like FMN-containing flavoprotein (pyridoxamine 5'-phosphate oxidase superfamily)
VSEHWFKAHIREMDRQESLEHLHGFTIGRLVFDDDRGPMALPVNYVVDGEDVLIATRPYGAIAHWTPGRPVAFEIDDFDAANETGWSVVVRGQAEVPAYGELPDDDRRPYPWAEGDRSFHVRVRTTDLTGRRLVPA